MTLSWSHASRGLALGLDSKLLGSLMSLLPKMLQAQIENATAARASMVGWGCGVVLTRTEESLGSACHVADIMLCAGVG